MRPSGWALFSAFIFSTVFAVAGTPPVCGEKEISAGYSYTYCIRQGNRNQNKDVVFFLHGLGGNARTWFTQTQGTQWIEKKWAEKGYRPTIVTVSFGEIWLLVNTPEYPLISAFKDEMMPFLESKIGGLAGGRRLLMGQSMGGFNSVQASLQLPGAFTKVVLMCPAITTVGPFDPPSAIDDYIQRTGANRSRVNLMLSISAEFFRSEDQWMAHEPFHLLQQYAGPKPVFLVTTGLQDEFGFQEGSEVFASQARVLDFSATWVPLPGPHCVFDRAAVANFILDGRR